MSRGDEARVGERCMLEPATEEEEEESGEDSESVSLRKSLASRRRREMSEFE